MGLYGIRSRYRKQALSLFMEEAEDETLGMVHDDDDDEDYYRNKSFRIK